MKLNRGVWASGLVLAVAFCVGFWRLVAGASEAYVPFENFEVSLNPAARQQSRVLFFTVEEYRRMRGRVADYDTLSKEGFIFFRLRNLVTGEPLSASCTQRIPGTICISVRDPYTLGGIWAHDANGSYVPYAVSNKGRFYPFRYIPPEERDMARRPYDQASRLGYTEQEMKAVMLGMILGKLVDFWGGKGVSEALAPFAQEPLKEVLDPLTGDWLAFDGWGYGERIRFVPDPAGAPKVTVRVLSDDRPLLELEVSYDAPHQVEFAGRSYRVYGIDYRVLPPLGPAPKTETRGPEIPM